jgi:hypothetical protein
MNLTPLALAAAYAYLNRSDKEKGDKETPAATPTIAPAAAPAAQTTNAADMLSANEALNAGMGDYDTTGNIGKPMPMVKPPSKKPAGSSSSKPSEVKPTTTSTRYPKISIAQATEDMEAGKKLAPPRKTNALGMELNEGTEEGLARMRERDRTVRGMPNIGDNISQSLENIRNRVKQNIGMKKGGDVKAYAKGGTVSASKRGDGIAQRGYTKGRIV